MMRLVVATILAGFVSMAASTPGSRAAEPAKRLNVLMIVVDDLNTDLGCYGNTTVSSPNIDRLAGRSVRFDRAYSQYPVCAPSRWSFLSGLRPETTRIWEFQTLLRSNIPDVVFLPQLFRQNGYFTAGMGKVFHSARQSDEISWDYYEDRMGDDEQEAAAVAARYVPKEGERPFTPYTRLDGPEEKTRDGRTSRKMVELMEASATGGKPFFIAAGFHKPHLPWTAPVRYYDLFEDRRIPEPRDPALEGVPPIALMTELFGNPLPPSRTEAISAYYSCIAFMDAQVGLLLDALDRRKLWDDTIVVLFSDHGYHLGDHDGLWAKLTAFDQGCRVPLLIAAPGHGRGVASPRTVELIDVYPTLAELCALSPPSRLEGKSLAPLLAKPDAAWDKPARSMVHHNDVTGKTVFTERWRYTEWDRGAVAVELYDREADPGEYRNLAGDPAYGETAAQMKQLLLP